MALIEQINQKDIERVIAFSQDMANPKIDILLNTWENTKTPIAQRFLNGQVMYTHPEKLQFNLSEEAKRENLCNFIESLVILFNDRKHPLVHFLRNITFEEFYQNSLMEEYIIDAKEGKKIQKGSKIVKSFKFFIDNTDLLTDLQNKASELIQENKVEGYLTFSVHPLDFLSSSENTYNWRSCHSLDGEYRAGNLSYMCDRSTMIIYLSPDKQEKLPHFPHDVLWNSKKWRMLVHFNEKLDVCFASRQYPFFSGGALEIVKEVFSQELAPYQRSWGFAGSVTKRENWAGWFNDYLDSFFYKSANHNVDIEMDRYCVINNGVFDRFGIIKDAIGSRHFNDVLRSSCYERPYYMFKQYYAPNEDMYFEIGAPVTCLKCGEKIINGHDSMMCSDCECKYGNSESDDYYTCDCCGTRFFAREGYAVGDDDLICTDCADRHTFICEDCGCRTYNTDQHWLENIGYLCEYCFNDRSE